jgi:hypothetical protein
VSNDLIFTQEDYRRYPEKYAAFVNFARQVFIENELCLLGFSGDDPNFLQWAGWVRDHLAGNVRRIYLVGALRLTAAKRKYLESLNVSPIDLTDLVLDLDADRQHQDAVKIFLDTLRELKPNNAWDWSPTNLKRMVIPAEEMKAGSENDTKAALRMEKNLPILEADRESYPGWIICPPEKRMQIQNQISDPYPGPKLLSLMSPDHRAKMLYEIAWRQTITLQVSPPWLVEQLLSICDPATSCSLSKGQQIELALVVLKASRWFEIDERERIESAVYPILAKGAVHLARSDFEVLAHKAIVARDSIDYVLLEGLVDEMSPTTPELKLRKAGFLAEIGQFDNGEQLINEAYQELTERLRHEPESLYLLSRLAWAHWVMRGVGYLRPTSVLTAFPGKYLDSKCSPTTHIDHIEERATKALEDQEKRRSIQPSFEPGTYTDHSKGISFNGRVHVLLEYDALQSVVGMPMRWDGVSFLGETAEKLTKLENIDLANRLAIAIRAANSDESSVLKRAFSRIEIARMSEIDARNLLEKVRKAIEYWSGKWLSGNEKPVNFAVERVRVFLEVLARLSVRSSSESAQETFRFACRLAHRHDFRHPWLVKPLDHVLEYALESISEADQANILVDALLFALPEEAGNEREWPNPYVYTPGARPKNPVIDRRIDEIIDRIAPVSVRSVAPLVRLIPLIEANFLSDQEKARIAVELWGAKPDYKRLPDNGLFKQVLMRLPSDSPESVERAVRSYLFEAESGQLLDSTFLNHLAHAGSSGLRPHADQALRYFDLLVQWRDPPDEDEVLSLFNNYSDGLAKQVGSALVWSIVPALPKGARTAENLEKLLRFSMESDVSEVLPALPAFSETGGDTASAIAKIIAKSLRDKDARRVNHAAKAVLEWRRKEASAYTDGLVSRLMYQLGWSRLQGLEGLLDTLSKMVRENLVTPDQMTILEESIPVVFDRAAYANVVPESGDASSASLVRAGCIRVSQVVLDMVGSVSPELNRILDEAVNDPLPEVRFANKPEA